VRRRDRPGGITSFNIVQLASDSGNAAALVFFLFDLLYLDGEDLRPWPLIERKERLSALLANPGPCLHYSDHVIGGGPAFYSKACAMHVEGIVSKRIDAPYTRGNRGLWRKVKCLNRAEFVVIGWTEPEGRRAYLGALLLAYYDPDGKLIYAGRAGTASTMPGSSAYGGGCSRSRPTQCRSTCRRRAAAGSDRRWCSVVCIGCGPRSSPR
jgi:ATP-dependent DNA ligase